MTVHGGADLSPFMSPRPRKRRCRAKALRNHNPRVGGSSPSSGMRSACKTALCCFPRHAEYIPRVPPLQIPESCDAVRCRECLADVSVPRAVPPGVDLAWAEPGSTAGPRPRKVPRSTWLRAASEARRRRLPCVREQSSQSERLLLVQRGRLMFGFRALANRRKQHSR
jgi:hypothetical protein